MNIDFDYIQILSDYGLLGLFIYVYMIYYVVRNILEGAGATLFAEGVANSDIMNMINELISSI